MASNSEIEKALEATFEVGSIRGELKAMKMLNTTQADTIKALHEKVEKLLARALAAEIELSAVKLTIKQIEDIRL